MTPEHAKPGIPSKAHYIVIDLEATCWNDDSRRGDGEIIEIGAVRMNRATGAILDEFQTFVRPTRYPRLSDFCIRLTSITQADVDSAPTFSAALAEFTAWIGASTTATFCSWGALDRFLLRQACQFHRVEFPFDDEYINVKPAFSDVFTGRGVSMERALEIAEIAPVGTRHRAIDDARNAALLWQCVLRYTRRTPR